MFLRKGNPLFALKIDSIFYGVTKLMIKIIMKSVKNALRQ